MKTAPTWIGLALAAGVIGASALGLDNSMWGAGGTAVAASAQQRAQGKKSLDRAMSLLQAVDTAYASGNATEAQTRFTQARSAWNSVAPMISAREAREAQLLFDSLGSQLKSGAPATQVRSTVSGMLDELREDIENELR